MYSIANRIIVKKGFAQRMAPVFTSRPEVPTFKGFIKIEVNLCTTHEEHDELNVMTYWETLEDYKAWRDSDSFKSAHTREAMGDSSPVLSNQVVVAEIVATQQVSVPQ
jgi:heme oxygenase (staphylobilin-producing)